MKFENNLAQNLAQNTVVTKGSSVKTDPASMVADGVLRVCKEMNVHYQMAEE